VSIDEMASTAQVTRGSSKTAVLVAIEAAKIDPNSPSTSCVDSVLSLLRGWGLNYMEPFLY